MVFSERLRNLLDYSDISIKELALQLGLSPSALGNYIRGYREPDFEILLRIANYFHVTTDYLLGNDPDLSTMEDEQKLLNMWKRFTDTQRKLTLEQMELIANYHISTKKNP